MGRTSTFVVQFIRTASGVIRGTVRHVHSGEEAKFASGAQLLRFFEHLAVVDGQDRAAHGHASRRPKARKQPE